MRHFWPLSFTRYSLFSWTFPPLAVHEGVFFTGKDVDGTACTVLTAPTLPASSSGSFRNGRYTSAKF